MSEEKQNHTSSPYIGAIGPSIKLLYLGIAANFHDDKKAELALVFHDSTYVVECLREEIQLDGGSANIDKVADVVVRVVKEYSRNHCSKVAGAGISTILKDNSPSICSKLWVDLDIVPVIVPQEQLLHSTYFWDVNTVEEQADSLARMCMMHFGPTGVPLVKIGHRGVVRHDHIQLGTIEDYKASCSKETWESMAKYATILREKKTKIAFFSATPQGGGVAIMRHALVRLSDLLGVDLHWYIPRPESSVFKVTKLVHNILQAVNEPGQRVHKEQTEHIFEWICDNAKRYWFCAGGPLSSLEEGGADVIIVDDPQMAPLVSMVKERTPDRPVIYRSHIQIRGDKIADATSPQAEAWSLLWNRIQNNDLFISHPVPSFVPANVPKEKLLYAPGTTDVLDGLNKKLGKWDSDYYGHLYNVQCLAQHKSQLDWRNRKYFIQVSRFDPAKDITTVIDSYGEFRRQCQEEGVENPPQLVVCGNGSSDDPDAARICDQAMKQIQSQYPHLLADISLMSLDPNDQVLNFLLSNAHVVLQLSTGEGFEVKVTEAQHAGRPVIATHVGGIALQVQHNKTGFFVQPKDFKDVANRLMQLTTDIGLWERMSKAATKNVTDETTAVGNAMGWYYLAAKFAQGERVEGNGRWLSDLARQEAGHPWPSRREVVPPGDDESYLGMH